MVSSRCKESLISAFNSITSIDVFEKLPSLRTFLIFFSVLGLLFFVCGVYEYILYINPPSQEIDANLSGFKVEQLEPPYKHDEFMYFGVNSEPPLLYFNFGYTPLRNGTYTTYLFFPFRIFEQVREPTLNGGDIHLSEYSGDFGALIIINATVQGQQPYHSVQVVAEYEVEKTFMKDDKGDLRIVLPLGEVSSIHQDEKINAVVPWGNLSDVFFENLEVYVGLPVDYNKIQTVPSLTTAPRLNPFQNENVQMLQWDFSNKPESILIFCEDSEEKAIFQTYLHWSGLLAGIGLPLFISTLVELVRLRGNYKTNMKDGENFGFIALLLVPVVAILLFFVLLTFLSAETQNSLALDIFKGLILSATAGVIAKLVWDKIKSPKLKAYVGEPTTQNLPKSLRRGFYHIRIRNEPVPLITQEAATHSRTKMTFRDNKKELFTLAAKWNWTPQPLNFQIYNKRLSEIPNPSLIPPSEFVDINPNDEESFCILMKYDGEDDCYAFNGFSYLHPDLKNPDWKLGLGEYRIEINLHSSNCHQTYYFKLINGGNSLSNVIIQRIAGKD